jgi:dienelactone hydrolase
LAATVDTVDLFLYPGDRHLFTDASLGDYASDPAALVMQRVLAFLNGFADDTPS